MLLERVRGFRPYVSCARQAIGIGQERGGIAAVEGDGEAQFFPSRGIHQGGDDGEIEADIEEDGADRAVAVLGDDFRAHLLLGRGLAVVGGVPGQPVRRECRFGGARAAWARPSPLAAIPQSRNPGQAAVVAARPPPPIPLPQGEGEKWGATTGEAAAEPGLERPGTEQTAENDDGDHRGIDGAEDGRKEGVPGEIIGVVFLAQFLDEVAAVGEQGAEEVEDLAGADGVQASGLGAIGIGLCRLGLCWCRRGTCWAVKHKAGTMSRRLS
jgi:hypothetical protein